MKWIGRPVAEIWPFEIFSHRYLGFDITRNSAIRSADPENPTLEPNMKCMGSPFMEIWPFEIIQDGGSRHLEFVRIEIAPLDPPSLKIPPYNQTWSGSDDRLRRYGHLKFFQHGGGHHLGFVQTVNSAIRSAVPENPTLLPNMKWIGSPVAEIWPFAYIGDIWNPHFGGKSRS